ncbi:hypothetical protein ANN_22203 [Periplaneta americana]|uniref:Uncharacterized protein n=1 Tax=Periplaneta americana TaxID=6978 RepID=A0ABQ8S7H4_PERAM|nr:hypothetical protein ANN_22203 [Periplaneta americana]
MAGLCEGGNEPPGSLKAIGRNLLFRNNSVPTPSCSLAQLLRARSTALHKCSDSELLTCPAVTGSQYRVAQGMFRLRDNSRNVGACSDEPKTAAVTLFSLFFMLYLELRWMKLVLKLSRGWRGAHGN